MSSASASPSLVWLRNDLRLTDNPALSAAASTGRPLLLVYVLDDAAAGRWRLGGAARWWLHHSLEALGKDVAARGGRLILRRGDSVSVLGALLRETNAAALSWNASVEPWRGAIEQQLRAICRDAGVRVEQHEGEGLFAAQHVRNGSGEPFKVFTPFWRACLKLGRPRDPLPAPARLEGPAAASEALADWALLPSKPDWAGGLRETWRPGEAAAQARLAAFVEGAVAGYGEQRNVPGVDGTSRLSPHLRFGEISPVQVWAAAEKSGHDSASFLSEIGWREFSRHLLAQFPQLPERAFRPAYEDFPWRDDPEGLEAWRRGRTGYPIVDAGMRQLWRTGWMHNRVRMITASFLIKHLLVDWRSGQDWFWDTLVDADLASNAASWQWVAGSGADAAPYFRVFNPITQGEKFDPQGLYIRRWLPELARLPDPWLAAPWTAPPLTLEAAGVRLGQTYPRPMVQHDAARARALAALKDLREA
jgi:deoxyribodipyrimidine photo-lyase